MEDFQTVGNKALNRLSLEGFKNLGLLRLPTKEPVGIARSSCSHSYL